MRRISSLIVVALVMAAMFVALAMPAFAASNCDFEDGGFICSGGTGSGGLDPLTGLAGGGSGQAGRTTLDESGNFTQNTGGGGGGQVSTGGGGGGGQSTHCSGNIFAGTECHHEGSF